MRQEILSPDPIGTQNDKSRMRLSTGVNSYIGTNAQGYHLPWREARARVL